MPTITGKSLKLCLSIFAAALLFDVAWMKTHAQKLSKNVVLWSQCSEHLVLFVFAKGARIGRSSLLGIAEVLE